MALTDKERDEILAKMSLKIESSPVLNGGFDKLVVIVESIKNQQFEQNDKLDTITNKLYEPTIGLFSRVQQLENDTNTVITNLEKNDKNVTEQFQKIEKKLEKIDDVKKLVDETQIVTKRLQRIGGEDLQDISKTVDLNNKLSKLYWSLIAVAFVGFGNLIWQLITHR